MAHHREPAASFTQGDSVFIVCHAVTMAQAAEQKTPWTLPDSTQPALEISPADASRLFSQVTTQLTITRELAQTLFGT
jgi:hypothetical protein